MWIINFTSSDLLFDVDKLRGFINSSQTVPSLIFLIIIYYFAISGFLLLIDRGLSAFDLKLFVRNFLNFRIPNFFVWNYLRLIQGVQFFIYYFFGLNKYPMRSLKIIEEIRGDPLLRVLNGLGEYFFTLLIIFLFLITKKINIKKIDFVLIFINTLGLIRTNNFAAISSLILFLE